MGTQKRKRLHPEARRVQLLECAVQVYANNGVKRAGHGDVAKLAGVSTATVFNYFPTRSDLTSAVFNEVKRVMRTIFAGDYPSDTSRRDVVMQLGEKFDGFVNEYPNLAIVFLCWSVAFSSDVRPLYLDFHEEMLNMIQSVLHTPREDRSDARIVLGAAQIYAQMKFEKLPDETLGRFMSRVAEVLNLD